MKRNAIRCQRYLIPYISAETFLRSLALPNIISTFGPDFERLKQEGTIFIARRVLRSSSFDERPMSRGRPQWGATFSIHKVERRDDENRKGTGADPESTDPVCSSVVDFTVVPFATNARRATARNHRDDIISLCLFIASYVGVCSPIVCRF